MSLLLALLAQATQTIAPAPLPMPPADWTTLRPLPFLRDPPDGAALSDFVRAEVQAGHCAAAIQGPNGWTLRVDVAVLVAAGRPRRVIPRAIQCPAVEQYAAGLVSSMARGNIAPATQAGDGWYKTSLTFAWGA
ncbi:MULTISPECIES: hypothetical protein [unclassified Sphingomonas]|uniref:hypothetical protein n=1 Tax=unclassified Sphingomonas TaxID=196159 RepID=UPI001E4740E4|nr:MULTISPECIES: hypothetical protein [unclassified Sphingomonas]